MVANSFFNFCFGRSTTAFPTSYKFIAYVVIVFILISTWHLCRYRSINKSKIQVRGLLIRKMGGGGGVVAHFVAQGLHLGNGVGCPRATRENFAIQGRLPLLPYIETVGSLVDSPLHPNMKKSPSQWKIEWAAHELHVGILQCK